MYFKKINKWSLVVLLSCIILTSGCKKYLDEPSDKKLVIATTLRDLQALMDDGMGNGLGVMTDVADEYYILPTDYQGLYQDEHRNLFVWKPSHVFQLGNANAWYTLYSSVYKSNFVLEQLPKMNDTKGINANAIKGTALLKRAELIYHGAQVWCMPYEESTASSMLGMPLKLNTDFAENSYRSTLAETYGQVISDLKMAVHLLDAGTPAQYRPSKQAAYGMLARVYLSMRKYKEAGLYADSCLQLQSVLLDFNTLNSSIRYAIPSRNIECVFFLGGSDQNISFSSTNAKQYPAQQAMYEDGDLRKRIYFFVATDGTLRFNGSHTNDSGTFTGITVGEMLLVRAESLARNGDIVGCLADLNELKKARWDKNVSFIPYVAATSEEAKKLALLERRKELLMRNARWTDVRRLNLEGANITLERNLDGMVYTLPPNDLRYALAIPEDIISLTNMPQNPR